MFVEKIECDFYAEMKKNTQLNIYTIVYDERVSNDKLLSSF